MLQTGDLFLSELLNRPVLDPSGEILGKVKDVSVLPGDPFPQVTGVAGKGKGRQFFILLEDIDVMNKKFVSIRLREIKETEASLPKEQFFLREQLLDKQLVDINGVKVVRVNDIKLGEFQNQFCLLGLDVGFQGLLRRLGLERKETHSLIPLSYVQPLEKGLNGLTLTISRQSLSKLHPVDIADLIAQMSSKERSVLLESLDQETAGEAIHELEADIRVSIVEQMDEEVAADVLEKMQPDEAADIIGDLSLKKAKSILNKMEKEEAADVEELLIHDEDTAGGLMTTEYVSFLPDVTTAEAIDQIRQQAPEIELIYYIYVVDRQERLLGVLSLRDLIISPPDSKLKDIMRPYLKKTTPETKQKEVAELVSKYNLLAVPVVDQGNHLLGIITVDDILNVLIPSFSIKRYK